MEELVRAEAAAGVASDRVIVAGFSQGGAVAMLMLRSELKLGGVVGARVPSTHNASPAPTMRARHPQRASRQHPTPQRARSCAGSGRRRARCASSRLALPPGAGLSTYMPLAKDDAAPLSAANKGTNILQCHGDADFTVNFSFGQRTHKLLQVGRARGGKGGRGEAGAGWVAGGV